MQPPLLPSGVWPRPADVILLAGASGIGKTNVSYRLAHALGMGLTEVDDLHLVLQRATTPEQQPAMHHFRTNRAQWRALPDAEKLRHMQAYAAEMSPYISIVIANHLESGCPMVIEGDFILPELMAQQQFEDQPARGRVRGVVLVEPDEAQILANYRIREGSHQPERAHASWLHSEWLAASARDHGVPVVAVRPWESVLERVLTALQTHTD